MIFFVGPTGVGKSSHAHQLAMKHKASILNCDSIQMYQEVSVGAAKPTAEEQSQVPHYLLDCIPAGETWTAADFNREARAVLEREAGKGPFFAVGGSGFYIRALEKGLYDLPSLDSGREREIKAELNNKSDQQMHEDLFGVDPETAKKLHVNDRYRVERALVIWHGFGLKPSEVHKQFISRALPYKTLKIGIHLEREMLREVLTARIEKMNQLGFREEVESLLSRGLEDWWPLRSVGYQEWVEVLRGRAKESEINDKILTSHMQLAKKQMTWFKKDPSILWMHTKKDQQKISDVVGEFLVTGVSPCKA